MSIGIRKSGAGTAARVARVALLLALAAPAQGLETAGRRGGEGGFSIGWTRVDLGPLNDVLAPIGYERFSTSALSLGGSGHSLLGRLVIGGQGHGMISAARDASLLVGPFRTRVRQGYGFFDLGWLVARSGDFELTPMVGIGGGATQLDIADHAGAPFDAVVRDPRRSTRLVRSAFLVDVGASVVRFVRLGAARAGRGGLIVGVRAGYVLAPAEGEWRQGDVELFGGPDSGLAGPYVRLLFGGRGVR